VLIECLTHISWKFFFCFKCLY